MKLCVIPARGGSKRIPRKNILDFCGKPMIAWPIAAAKASGLLEALHDAAQFYWGLPEAWTQSQKLFHQHSTPLILPRWRVQDIDTPDDWRRAELVAKCMQGVSE